MNLVDRVKNILLKPKEEWPVIAGEATDVKTLYTTYIMVLAAIPAVMSILTVAVLSSMISGFAKVGLGMGVVAAIIGYALSLGMVYVVALIADALAPNFDGEKNFLQALKLVAYSMTASWIGAVFNIIPLLGWLLSFLAGLYGIYLFFTGVASMMKVPENKVVGYTVVVIIAAIVVMAIIGTVTGMIMMMGTMGAVGMGARPF